MAIITVPARFVFSAVNSFKLQRATNTLRSKFTGQGQVVLYPYAVWVLNAKLVELDGIAAGQVRSFLVQLDGQANSFRLPVPGYSRPSTGYVGNGLANGAAAARASSINVRGLTASVALLNEGDYFTVQDELKIVTSALASNAGGLATISFKPPLRKAVADGVAVTLQNPWCLMQASDDDVADWSLGPPTRQNTKFEAIENVTI